MTQNQLTSEILDALFADGPDTAIVEQAHEKLLEALQMAKMNTVFYASFQHDLIGTFYVATRSNKLIALDFGISQEAFILQIEKSFGQAPYYNPDDFNSLIQQLQDYLNGRRTSFDIPFDLSVLTSFQRQVLLATLQIPRGQIITYGELARRIGNPKSVRAVGQALGRNPIPIVIPCHRVIASDGSLGGYSGGGGLETKARLLKLEGAQLFA